MTNKTCELTHQQAYGLKDDHCQDPYTTRHISLLAAAEEAYSQAAGVLFIALKTLKVNGQPITELDSRLNTGTHLLQEAMDAHNRYMDSLTK